MISSDATQSASALWAGVDRLIDRSPSLADLRAHGLHLLAARRWRRLRLRIPDELAAEEMQAADILAMSRKALAAAREAYEGPLMVFKGPEAAQDYPRPYVRPFGDIDLFAADAEDAHRALVNSGFVPADPNAEYYDGLHHMQPLYLPEAPIVIEIHRRPNWFDWGDPPTVQELFAAAIPSRCGVPGLRAPGFAHHTLLLAGHAWAELPFRRALDLIDVAAAAENSGPREAGLLAQRWGMERMWRITSRAIESLLFDRPAPVSLRIWARNLEEVRDRTVLETHLRRWMSPWWVLPPHRAFAASGRAMAVTLLPSPTDTWDTKAARIRMAIRDRTLSSAAHANRIGPEAHRPPRFTRR